MFYNNDFLKTLTKPEFFKKIALEIFAISKQAPLLKEFS